ncbi:MAG: hypothetical protein ACRDSZ_12560 [Pseudonocardiaceae bacterium]
MTTSTSDSDAGAQRWIPNSAPYAIAGAKPNDNSLGRAELLTHDLLSTVSSFIDRYGVLVVLQITARE